MRRIHQLTALAQHLDDKSRAAAAELAAAQQRARELQLELTNRDDSFNRLFARAPTVAAAGGGPLDGGGGATAAGGGVVEGVAAAVGRGKGGTSGGRPAVAGGGARTALQPAGSQVTLA